MKKYLLPLILILLLTFTLIGDCAWLSGWDQRIELSISDYAGDIGASVTWFPATVFLTATQGEEVFVELTTDAEYSKVAFTKADGTTELYGECELFDVSEELGIYHVSRDGWTINANTSIYMYYDKDHADNDNYIGVKGHISQPPGQSDTYVKSTTKYDTNYWAYYVTDPSKSLIGDRVSTSWLTPSETITNQRFHIDLGSVRVIKKIYYENAHTNGTQTNTGVQNFTFWGSNTGAGTFDDLVYVNDEGWTQLTISQSTFDQHTASDVADPKYIIVTNSTAYKYYAFKFADNHGDASHMGIRCIGLQTDACVNVWDGDFEAVYHMVDATTSTIKDSTSNNNDGTKSSANNPIEAVGKVGQGQDFSTDYIHISDSASLDITTAITIETVAEKDANDIKYRMIAKYTAADPYNGFQLSLNVSNLLRFAATIDSAWVSEYSDNTIDLNWHHLVGVYSGSEHVTYVDGSKDTGTARSGSLSTNNEDLRMGRGSGTNTDYFNGILDETRISSTTRTTAWIKGTYNSLWDTLLTYGSEETEAADNAIFFGTDF